jgi:hypothetical protein
MPAVILQNNMEADGPVSPPTHEDGKGYRYCMYFRNDADVAFSDTYDELMDVIIPGYEEMDDAEQAYQRIRLAQAAAAQIQAMILAEIEEDAVSPEEYAILTAPRGAKQPEANWWTSDVPLVVVETSYQPFTDVPRPASGISAAADAPNLIWLRPAENEELLLSLHEVGYLRLMENTLLFN